MLEYAHLSVKLDLKKAIGEVKEACENIQRTTEHVRRKAEGMDIHAMMQRQERLCLSFAQEMYSQLYALGREIHVRGIPDPFQMRRSKRKESEEKMQRIVGVKRQAIAIGATLMGGYVLNNEWEWIKDELGIGSGNVESGLVHDVKGNDDHLRIFCLLYTSPSPRD